MIHCLASKRWGVAIMVALLLCAVRASAQEELHEVTVVATRPLAPTEQRIDSTLIRSLNAHSVADVLRYASGVQIKDYGGVAGLKTVNIRGMGTEHTAIVYDGVHVVSAQNGQVDLGRFATDNLRMVSLMDVSNLLSASESALATTVVFETARPERTTTRLKLKAGSFGTWNGNVLWNWVKKLANSLSAQALTTNGRYRFHVARKDGYDTVMTRRNGDVKVFRIEDNLWWRGTQMKLYGYYSHRGLPGAVVREEPGKFRHQDRQTDMDFFFQGKTQWNAGRVRMAVKWKTDWNSLHYVSDPRLDVTTMYVNNTYRQTEQYASLAAQYSLPVKGNGRGILSAALDLRHNYLDADLTDFVYPHRLRIFANAIAQYTIKDFTARAMLLVQGFEDWARSHTSLWRFTPALTLTQRLGPVTVEGIYKSTVRQPTFNDLYYTFIGNANLKPEELQQLMLAATLRIPHLTLTAKPYMNWTTNKIVAIPTSNQFRWTMMNLGRVETAGVSASAETAFNISKVGLTLRATYDFTRARDLTDRTSTYYGGQIPYIPWHAASLVGSLTWWDFTLSASFLYTGERYESSANIPENYTKPWYTTDLSLRWHRRRLGAALEVNNLFNQQYEVVQCYPMPGTNFKGIVTYEF